MGTQSTNNKESDNNRMLALKEYLYKRYGNYIGVKQKTDAPLNVPHILAFHRFASLYEELHETTDVLYAVAQQYPKVPFALGDWDDHRSPNNTISVLGTFDEKQNPIVYAVNGNVKRKFKQGMHVKKLAKFCEIFLENLTLTPNWLPLSMTKNTHLKIIVEYEFDDFVTENPKDIYIVFYKPHVDYLILPLLYKLTTILHNTGDGKHIDVVCMETSINICNLRSSKYADIQSHFIKSDKKSELIKHTEVITTVDNILTFIARNSSKGLKNYTSYGTMKCNRRRHSRKDWCYDSPAYVERFKPESSFMSKKYGITSNSNNEEPSPSQRIHPHLEVKHEKPQRQWKADYKDPSNAYYLYNEKYGVEIDGYGALDDDDVDEDDEDNGGDDLKS